MGEVPVRAIAIGVSVFLVIITLTVIIMYVSTARQVAVDLNDTRYNIAVNYNKILSTSINDDIISGTDFMNFIKENIGNKTIILNIPELGEENVLNNSMWLDSIGNIKSSKLELIKNTSTVTLIKNTKGSVVEITATMADRIEE